jgi:hypothetical protein
VVRVSVEWGSGENVCGVEQWWECLWSGAVVRVSVEWSSGESVCGVGQW